LVDEHQSDQREAQACSSLSHPGTNARALAKDRLDDESIFLALAAGLGDEIGSVVSSSTLLHDQMQTLEDVVW
jgi:hypothetical protein